jgi:hypothetical protein
MVSTKIETHFLNKTLSKKCYAQVRSTAPHTIHLQFNISANALKIRAVQSSKWWTVDCTGILSALFPVPSIKLYRKILLKLRLRLTRVLQWAIRLFSWRRFTRSNMFLTMVTDWCSERQARIYNDPWKKTYLVLLP